MLKIFKSIYNLLGLKPITKTPDLSRLMNEKEVLENFNDAYIHQKYFEKTDRCFCKTAHRMRRYGYLTKAVHITDTVKGIICVWYFPSPANPLTEKGIALLEQIMSSISKKPGKKTEAV